eukprot:m.105707 g.105707  ORF g.105707 m.105707 type:complete len:75 (-) comp15126_c0_seq1:331-555(-)
MCAQGLDCPPPNNVLETFLFKLEFFLPSADFTHCRTVLFLAFSSIFAPPHGRLVFLCWIVWVIFLGGLVVRFVF